MVQPLNIINTLARGCLYQMSSQVQMLTCVDDRNGQAWGLKATLAALLNGLAVVCEEEMR